MSTKIIIVIALIVAFVAAYFLLFQDSSSQPQILEQDKFVDAYVELATLAEKMPIGTPEYTREKERVLHSIGVEPEQVEKALAMYNDHPDMWQPVWERIQKRLEERQSDVGSMPATETPHDSN